MALPRPKIVLVLNKADGESGSKLHALPRKLSGLAQDSDAPEPREAYGVRPPKAFGAGAFTTNLNVCLTLLIAAAIYDCIKR